LPETRHITAGTAVTGGDPATPQRAGPHPTDAGAASRGARADGTAVPRPKLFYGWIVVAIAFVTMAVAITGRTA
jgi:hypothetical protein